MKTETDRIIFLDYLRVIACFMVVMVHACEFYYCNEAGAILANDTDRLWVSLIDGAFRQSVPLFVMASSFLLVPLTTGATTFFKRRFSRVLVPFIVWSLLYAVVPVLTGSISGDIWQRVTTILYTANIDSGHLWFIYMLIGVYLVMPVISPWINQVSKRGEEMFLAIWFLSTFTGYMMHIFILVFMQQWIAPHFPTLPAILLVGTATFLACILVSRLISLIPFSKWIIG
ncbi:MAG: acyltransferase family protein [Duncaniella sp.]|nr:acyltransferase family protein [Duncaniella sp.]